MARQIKSVSDLPKWFDTNKYSDAAKLRDARNWYYQLVLREACLEIVSSQDFEEAEEDDDYDGLLPADFLSAVRSVPICNGDSGVRQYIEELFGYADPTFYFDQSLPPGIHGVSASDIGALILEWEPKRQQEFLDWLEFKRQRQATPGDRSVRRKRFKDAHLPLKTDRMTPVWFSMGFPERLLEQSFRHFLDLQQSNDDRFSPTKPKRQNTYALWADCGLLQYLDLMIWSIEEDVRITNNVFARAIFRQEKSDDNIRKVTQNHAAKILNARGNTEISMSTLWAYARLEVIENASEVVPEENDA